MNDYDNVKHKKGEKYWYLIVSTECVMCGRGKDGERHRMYTPKPEKWEDRYVYEQYVCTWCSG